LRARQSFNSSRYYHITAKYSTILSPKEIKEEIGFLNIKKAPGTDKITTKMMKKLPKKEMVVLTYIFNAILLAEATKNCRNYSDTETGKRPKGTNVVSSNKFTVHSQQNI
jgi:hypothetical protein